MANAEQLAILKQGVKVWNEWRNQHPASAIDLNGAELSGANLRWANLYEANLSEADLSRAFLKEANFMGAHFFQTNLAHADLFHTNLRGANLREARITRADLRSAYLSEADLSEADLSGANLMWADLSGADLSYAQLSDTNLTNASCGRTVFVNVDLSTVKGLETIRHTGPSFLSFDVIFQSIPRLPDVFLRGCGMPEIMITYLPSMIGTAIEFYSCFISYSHADKAFARRVHDMLQGRGIRCWLDEKNVNPGEDIYREVAHGIRYWDKLILCSSEASLKSWWVDNELDIIFEKERQIQEERNSPHLRLVIPLALDEALFDKANENPKIAQIRKRIAADFRGWEHDNTLFDEQIERVIKALRTDGAKEPPPPSKL